MSALSDRYEVLGLLASGGMASVLYGRLKGPAGFQREVAIKRLHPHFARDAEFLQMFVDEAHICARLTHANIVSAFDVIETPPDLCLVMEYVPGAGLDVLLHAARARATDVPLRIAAALLSNVLHGLHAAHRTSDAHGAPLGIVHRDVSPSNVLVGEDGIGRVLDFGIARAVSQLRATPGGELKGKFAYMAPELLRGDPFDCRLDVYAAAVVLWEVLAGRTLHGGQANAAIMQQILHDEVRPPSQHRSEVSPALDRVVMKGLARDPEQRFETAREFATALERACGLASQHEVSEWMQGLVGELLARRASELRRLQRERPQEGPVTQVGEREPREPPTVANPRSDPALDVPLEETVVREPAITRPASTPGPSPATVPAESATPSTPPRPPRRRVRALWVTAALSLSGALAALAPTWPREPVAAPSVSTQERAYATPTAPSVEQRDLPAPAHERAPLVQRDLPAPTPARAPLVQLGLPAPARTPAPAAPVAPAPVAPAPVAPAPVAPAATRAHGPSEGERVRKARRRVHLPSGEPSEAASEDVCAHAVQLQTVRGVVVKTYKPECLE